jgi:hypothetical protein
MILATGRHLGKNEKLDRGHPAGYHVEKKELKKNDVRHFKVIYK